MNAFGMLVGAGALCAGVATAATAEPASAEPDVAAAKAQTSKTCFNAAIYAKGVFIDYDYNVTGMTSGKQRETYLVTGKKQFNGVSAYELKTEIVKGLPFDSKVSIYRDISKGYILTYGNDAGSSVSTFSPPEKFPIDAKKGDQLKQSVKFKIEFKDGGGSQFDRKTVTTFNGFEKLDLKFGKVNACKFTVKTTMTEKGSSDADTYNDTLWFAAEGKYRGWILKAKYGQANSGVEVTKFHAFDVK